jgi:SAM-dependent methyltransferase
MLKTPRKKVRAFADKLLLNPNIRKLLQPGLRPWLGAHYSRTHPIDEFYNIDTSGFHAVGTIHPDPKVQASISPYIGCQPSVARAALAALPATEDYSLVELGCGKGRVVIIGSEFPFKDIIGIELSPDLAKIAQTNVDKVTKTFPQRPPMRVIEGDILTCLPVEGRVAFFFYHSFNRELTSRLVEKIEAALAANLEHAFFIYCNPVWGSVFDASPALRRWSADTIVHDPSEASTELDKHDNVVIWQSVRNAYPDAHPGANREIIYVHDMRAELAPLAETQ